MPVVDITWNDFRALPLESRIARVEAYKTKGYGVLKLAKVWGVGTGAIYKALSTPDELPALAKETVKDRLAELGEQMDKGVSRRLVEIAVELLSYEISIEHLAELTKENDDLKAKVDTLRQEYQEVKASFDAIMSITERHKEVSDG